MLVNDVVKEPIIRKTWANNKVSSTILVSIPSELAHRYGIKAGCNLVIEERPEGLLFKHLVIGDKIG
jgi:bifunctional DNA-binding transcriptional regulator/antitoxin component of YhaV-PrlF toxin-antitoxin module